MSDGEWCEYWMDDWCIKIKKRWKEDEDLRIEW